MAAQLTAAETVIHHRASQALDRLRAEWRTLGVPHHGARGLLMAEILLIGLREEGITIDAIIADILASIEACAEKGEPWS